MSMSKLTEDRVQGTKGAVDDLISRVGQIDNDGRRREAEKLLDDVKVELTAIEQVDAPALQRNVEPVDSLAAVSKAKDNLSQAAKIVISEGPNNGMQAAELNETVSIASAAMQDTANSVRADAAEVASGTPSLSKVAWFAARTLAVFGVLYVLMWVTRFSDLDERVASAIAFVVLTAGLTVLYWAGRGSFSLLLKGTDGRYSTSKVQVAMWTLIVVLLLGYLALYTALGATDAEGAGLTSDRVDDYLILLGGPFAAAVLAKLLTTSKVESGVLQKTTAPAPEAAQLFQDDGENTDLVDAQYLLFNLVAMAFVVVAFVEAESLPAVPAVLLGLTGVSAATYTSNKALLRNAPTIISVTPATVRPGDEVSIAGSNFKPANALEASHPGVQISEVAGELTPGLDASDSLLKVRIPIGLEAGTYEVKVRTTGNMMTSGYRIAVVEDKPLLVGVKEAEIVRGAEVTVFGRYLLPPGQESTADRRVSISMDGEIVDSGEVVGRRHHQQELTVKIPMRKAAGPYDLSIKRRSVTSNALPIVITDPA